MESESSTEEMWENIGMVGWIKCKTCSRHLMIKDAKEVGCARCGNIYIPKEGSVLGKIAHEVAISETLRTALETDHWGRENPSIIFPWLFHGGVHNNANNREKLLRLGVKYIVNCTQEQDNIFPEVFVYKKISVWDFETTDLRTHFDDASKFIHEGRSTGANVFVHCAAGISRSTTIILAYLMKYEKMKLKDAFLHVKRQRPCVCPNRGFIQQLVAYELELFGENSVTFETFYNLL